MTCTFPYAAISTACCLLLFQHKKILMAQRIVQSHNLCLASIKTWVQSAGLTSSYAECHLGGTTAYNLSCHSKMWLISGTMKPSVWSPESTTTTLIYPNYPITPDHYNCTKGKEEKGNRKKINVLPIYFLDCFFKLSLAYLGNFIWWPCLSTSLHLYSFTPAM